MNTTKFVKGDPRCGRPKGALSQTTIDIREFSRRVLREPEYVASLKERLREGKAPHMETLLHFYAWGRPKESIEVSGMSVTELRVMLLDSRNGGNGNGDAIEIEAVRVEEIESGNGNGNGSSGNNGHE